ncbi:MAG: hypothetical protein NE330_02635 [Lentisphaeraceae bacterium]|nr:hypothetical protein [Lentisphaeraceae bacterium]
MPNFTNYDFVISHINDKDKTRLFKFQKSLESYIHSGGWGGRKAGVAGYLLRTQEDVLNMTERAVVMGLSVNCQ